MISLVCATKGRQGEMRKLLHRIYETKTSVPFETIIVTSDLMDDPGFRHPNHRVVVHGIPGAVPAAERGIMEARGQWVWLLNDDITIETENWLDLAWGARFHGLIACRDGHQDYKAPIVPFPMFSKAWYMRNFYPMPYVRYSQDRELCQKAMIAEEMGVRKLPEVLLKHHHDFNSDHLFKKIEFQEQALCKERVDAFKANRPPIIGVCTYRAEGSRRPLVIRRMVEQLRKIKTDFTCLIFDDASTCPEQSEYLKSIYGLDGKFYVKFFAQNLGSNGTHQRFFDVFLSHETRKWILLDDDLVILETDWLDRALKAMDHTHHLFIPSRSMWPHPHGFFMGGSYVLLRDIGGYDLKTFPLRYGDCHCDFTWRAQRAGLAQPFDLEIDFKGSTELETANVGNQAEFLERRKAFDMIVVDRERVGVPRCNSNLKWLVEPQLTTVPPSVENPNLKFRHLDGRKFTPFDFWIGMKTYVAPDRLDRRALFEVTVRTLLETTRDTGNPVVILDDGSANPVQDRILDAIRGYEDRVEIVKLSINRGVAHAQNRLLMEWKKTDYRAAVLIDDDVEFSAGWLEDCADRMSLGRDCEHSWAIVMDHPDSPGGYLLTLSRPMLTLVGAFDESVCPYGAEHEYFTKRAMKVGLARFGLRSGFLARAKHLAWGNAAHPVNKQYREENMAECVRKFRENATRHTFMPFQKDDAA